MGLLDNVLGSSLEGPRTQATAALVQGLLGSPRTLQGISGGLLGYGGAMQQARQQAAADELRKMQLAHMAQQFRQQQAAQDQAERDRALTQRAFTPVSGGEAASMAGGPTVAGTGLIGKQPAFDAGQFIASGGSADKAFALQAALRKENPELKEIQPMRLPGGGLANVAVFKDGSTKVLPYGVRPDIALQNLGNRVAAIDKNAIDNGAQLDIGVSPDAAFSGGVTMRGQNLTDARARDLNAITREAQMTQVVTDPTRGTQLVNKGTGVMRPAVSPAGQAIPSEEQAKGAKQVGQLQAAIGDAKKLLGAGPTASGLGSLTDTGLGFFGASTNSADTAAKLDTLSGWMVANVPRMEGPQSNYDVQNYKTMAGLVGDRTKPLSQRIAALQTVEGLMKKYASLNGGAAPVQSAGDDPLGLRNLLGR